MTTAQTNPAPAHVYWTMGRGDSDRAFRTARRHSRVVRFLRVAIPLAGVLGCTGIFMVSYFNPMRMLARLPVDIGNMVVSGSKITMEKPHLSGFTHDARAYELSADAARQDLTKPDMIELRNIHAKVQMQDKSMLELSAAAGIYDSKGETIKFDQNIVLTSSTGYSGRLSEAMVDIRKGHVVSTRPVVVEMLQGTLNANRLEIVDSGELVRFDGGVKLDLVLHDGAAASAKTGVQ
ncbi:MAG TPA: LPS export ABC transporter periplasmic protein LptC [Pseudolabrys sp.]|jgi:lipopolysaccharide export system protein LptC